MTEKETHHPEHSAKRDFFDSPKGKIAAIAILGAIAALLVFQAGVSVGYRKARFSYNAGDRFARVWGERREGELAEPGGRFVGGHGAAGKVVSIALPAIIVSTPENIEKEVIVGGDTAVRRFRDIATSTDIRTGDYIVALGDPDGDGAIQAKLIRIVPEGMGAPFTK